MQKERLEELLDLAQTYRGWSRRRLAEALGRDASNLVPDSGIPKLDLVVELARVLDWPVEVVIGYLHADEAPAGQEEPDAPSPGNGSFEQLDDEARAAHRDGRYTDLVDIARRAFALAATDEQRAVACNREAGGWDGLGRYADALAALRRGLQYHGALPERRLLLLGNLANAYYTMWHLDEGIGVATSVVQRFESRPPATFQGRIANAIARYVRGNCYRRMLARDTTAIDLARSAKADLACAYDLLHKLSEERGDDSYTGIANTCRGALIEVETMLGERTPAAALEEFQSVLEKLVDPTEFPVGDWLESYGWWCIFGCNVALRHVEDDRELQQVMALFTNKADEIAERLDNWSIRERVFTLGHARRQHFADWTGVEPEWLIDQDDLRVLAGTMGRFPAFHEVGRRIIQSAKVIRDN